MLEGVNLFFLFLARSCIFSVLVSTPEISDYGFIVSFLRLLKLILFYMLTTANMGTVLYNSQSTSHAFSHFILPTVV